MRRLITNRLFTAFLCLALLFKVLVPVGFMPDFNALRHGVYKITICTGTGHQSILVDQNQKMVDGQTQKNDHRSDKFGNDYCPYAGMHASALPLVAILLATLLLVWRRLRFVPTYGTIQSMAHGAAWPRGPPLHLA